MSGKQPSPNKRQQRPIPTSATGEKQTIQARHGTATFVPKGFSIKIINTYGKQVVDTWAFALGPPPQDEDFEDYKLEEEEEVKPDVVKEDVGVTQSKEAEQVKDLDDEKKVEPLEEEKKDEKLEKTEDVKEEETLEKTEAEKDENLEKTADESDKDLADQNPSNAEDPADQNAIKADDKSEPVEDTVKESQDGTESKDKPKEVDPQSDEDKITPVNGTAVSKDNKQAEKDKSADSKAVEDQSEKQDSKPDPSTPKASGKIERSASRRWSSYIPSVRGLGYSQSKQKENQQQESQPQETQQKEAQQKDKVETNQSKRWTAYIPNIPSIRSAEAPEQAKETPAKEQKTWASYIPSGQGYSSYLPTKESVSAFVASHQRDPTKSVAEQLYDFSKTPVGAAGLSAASGGGYARTIYAAYSAYNQTVASKQDNSPGMEFLSMPHTRASTQRLSPRVGDVLVSNLRAPLLTLVEDTSPGIHDTLMAACDPQRYKQLGVEKWEEHGSCAENLVLALQELNKRTGLKGRKAIGSDVTVNSVPAPLNLFMNIPWTPSGTISFESPKGTRGDFVRFRAERDVVVVMSACPQDLLAINAKKPMVAHFVVESPSEEDKKAAEARDAEAQRIIEKARRRTEKQSRPLSIVRSLSRSRRQSQTPEIVEPPQKTTERVSRRDIGSKSPNDQATPVTSPVTSPGPELDQIRNTPIPGRNRPRKLQRKSSSRSSGPRTPK